MRPNALKDERGALYELGPTRSGETLLKHWVDASIQADRSRARADQDSATEREAEQNLGNWLLPPDATEGEKVCMWNGPNLIQAEKTADGVRVTIRSRHTR